MTKKKSLVIVESPTKAKTISRFLDSNYTIIACMGHIRDLPESAKDIPAKYKDKPWKNLGVNTEDNFEPIYCIPKSKNKVISELKKELEKASELILATDEDREGESISWHLSEILKPKVPVKRIVFHEITKTAIQSALKNPRQVDKELVQAQEARRVLDRLVGYTLSPLLWKKIAPGLSAGRVQSVAVKLISEKEIERMNFVSADFYSMTAELSPSQKEDKLPTQLSPLNSKKIKYFYLQKLDSKKEDKFPAQLSSLNSKKIAGSKDFDSKGQLKNKNLLHLKKEAAQKLLKELKSSPWTIKDIKVKPVSRSPKPPFITSTLQQEAYGRLGFSPKQTMSTAQKLYEKGLITYMRTDSTNLSKEALQGVRKAIERLYGKKEVPDSPRFYKSKSKGAQEAHEAIRPAGQTLKEPSKSGLSDNELKLYNLIWQRTLASQMKNCEQKQTSVEIAVAKAIFHASGLQITSPGFYKVYKNKDSSNTLLPELKKGANLNCHKLESQEKKTQAPFRYNEASLIQKLEKEGIGRPSTYAPVISTIQDRGYIKKEGKNLAPTFTAIAVTKLLSEYLPDYVDLNFTSDMEKKLDDIAEGETNYAKYLSHIYKGKKGLKELVKEREKSILPENSRRMKFPPFKEIIFNVGRFGAYITQKKDKEELKSSLPDDLFLSDLTLEKLLEILKTEKKKDVALGKHPQTKQNIFIKTGRFGPYLELEGSDKKGSIPRFLSPSDINIDQAVQLLELPKVLGIHPETKKEVKKGIGRFGPYIMQEGDFRSVPSDKSFLDLDLKEALKILAQEKKGGRKGKTSTRKPLKEFTHEKETIQILEGYSPYIKYKKKNYSLSKDTDISKLTLEDVLKVIEEKAPSSSKKKKKKKK